MWAEGRDGDRVADERCCSVALLHVCLPAGLEYAVSALKIDETFLHDAVPFARGMGDIRPNRFDALRCRTVRANFSIGR